MTKKSQGRLIKESYKTQQDINNAYSLAVAKLGEAQYRLDKTIRESKKEIGYYSQLVDELHAQSQELARTLQNAQKQPVDASNVVEATQVPNSIEKPSYAQSSASE